VDTLEVVGLVKLVGDAFDGIDSVGNLVPVPVAVLPGWLPPVVESTATPVVGSR